MSGNDRKKPFDTDNEILLIADYWLDSDLIPRLLEIFEKMKTFMVILLSVKNDANSRILGA